MANFLPRAVHRQIFAYQKKFGEIDPRMNSVSKKMINYLSVHLSERKTSRASQSMNLK